jgi:ribonuclease HII
MICGIDEAGRGPLAGPVCAAAVILSDDFPVEYLNDSKKLSVNKRRIAEALIYESAATGTAYGIGWASHEEIDALNILKASLLAMKRAFEAIQVEKRRLIDEVIVDGHYTPDIAGYGVRVNALVKADGIVPQVMAASILAKEARDRVMEDYAKRYPQYGYERHKGYATKLHCERIFQYGQSPIQRKTFKIPYQIPG